jgi:hypothetical protein
LIFQFFPFPFVEWPNFSKFKNQNFNSNFRNKKNKFFSFQIFLWHKRFFLGPRLPNLLKDCENYRFTLTKNSYILHTAP